MSWESINHSLLSPSGRVSNRHRRAALKAEDARLAKAWAAEAAKPKAPELSRIERLQKVADGHPDNPSVQAARRLLAKVTAAERSAS